jgi:ribosomal protein L11 methyltransferase
MNDWLCVTINTPPLAGEAISEALFEAGANGLWEDNPDELGRQVFKAGFANGLEAQLMASLPSALVKVANAFEIPLADFFMVMENVVGEDYCEIWKKDLLPIKISSLLLISPSWWSEPLTLEPSTKVLQLDPGSAFGSGRHPTTFLCLKLLSDLVEKGNTPVKILDLGSGSGILALSAALLLPNSTIIGLDDDVDTLVTATANQKKNQLKKNVTFSSAPLSTLKHKFDLILANLTLDPLVNLSPSITNLLNPEAFLILSGLLETQVAPLQKAYASLGWQIEKHLGQAEWSAILLVKKDLAPGLKKTTIQREIILSEIRPEDQD